MPHNFGVFLLDIGRTKMLVQRPRLTAHVRQPLVEASRRPGEASDLMGMYEYSFGGLGGKDLQGSVPVLNIPK